MTFKRSGLYIAFVVTAVSIDGRTPGDVCDMSPDGSVWLTVARLVWAEQKFHELHGRYGTLVEMTNPRDGLPSDVTAGRMGSYAITVNLTKDGFILRANPDFRQWNRTLASFYGDQSGLVTFDRSGRPAGPQSESMGGGSSSVR